MEDYLTKSPFGQVAGSLLSRRDSDYKKALGISLFGSVLQEMNLSKQADMQQNIQRTQEEYDQVFANNEEIWANKDEERGLYRSYNAAVLRGEDAKNDFIDREAQKRFNEDAHIISELGQNAYPRLSGLTQESRDVALQTFQEKRGQVVEELETFKDDKSITSPTFTKFNQAAYRELQAQLDIYQNDPAKQSVILNTFGNIFGIYDRKRAELSLSLENAQRVRREQEATYDQVSFEEITQNRNQVVAEVLQNEVGVLPDGQPITSSDKFDFIFTEDVEEAEEKEQREKDRERDIAYQQETRDFMSYTRARDKETDNRADQVQAEVDDITNSMQAPDYVVTTEDLTEALRLSINPLNIPNWDAITTYNAPKVVEIFGTMQQANTYRPGLPASFFLEGSNLALYDAMMKTDTEGDPMEEADYQNKRNRSIVAQLAIDSIGDTADIEAGPRSIPYNISTDDPRRVLLLIEGDFELNEEGTEDASTRQADLFITHTMIAADRLQKRFDMPPEEALQTAFDLQRQGISPMTGGGRERIGGNYLRSTTQTTHSVEYVDPDVYYTVQNIIPDTAERVARYMTSEKWLHRTMTYTNEATGNQESLEPQKGKFFTLAPEEGEDFEITMTAVPNLKPFQNQEKWDSLPDGDLSKTYKWTPSISYTNE